MNDHSRGEDILKLLEHFPAKSLGGVMEGLFDAAYEKRLKEPEKAIRHCQGALDIFEKRTQGMLYPEESADAKGRFHVLLASLYLNGEKELEQAQEHYLHARDTFHSRQWSHLESLTNLGLAITQRKLKKYKEAIVACEAAEDGLEYESIPDRIDTTSLHNAIEKERWDIEELLFHQQLTWIPIVSDVAAGVGRIPEEKTEEQMCLDDSDRKGADFGLRVVGDSMAGDGILNGDIALIRQQPGVENGQIAAVVITTPKETVGVLKRYYAYEEPASMGHWFLRSSNPSSKHLLVIPRGTKVDAIKALYGRLRNPIEPYENAELTIAGKYVGRLGKNI